jgi:hypothetical protein
MLSERKLMTSLKRAPQSHVPECKGLERLVVHHLAGKRQWGIEQPTQQGATILSDNLGCYRGPEFLQIRGFRLPADEIEIVSVWGVEKYPGGEHRF